MEMGSGPFLCESASGFLCSTPGRNLLLLLSGERVGPVQARIERRASPRAAELWSADHDTVGADHGLVLILIQESVCRSGHLQANSSSSAFHSSIRWSFEGRDRVTQRMRSDPDDNSGASGTLAW